MILKKAVIANYRGINSSVAVNFDSFNCIVGQNDAGKSTILKAIDCVLNENNPTRNDYNVNSQENCISIGWCLNSKFSIFISLLNIILVDKNMNSRNVHCLLLRETQALTNKPTHSSPDSRITTLYMACFTPILATFMQTWIKGFIIGFPHIAFGDEVLITWRNVCAKLLTGFDASITNIITDYLFCSTT